MPRFYRLSDIIVQVELWVVEVHGEPDVLSHVQWLACSSRNVLLGCDNATPVMTMMISLGDFSWAAVVSEFEFSCGRLLDRLLVKIRERHEARVNPLLMWLEGHFDIESLIYLSVFWNWR